jgi:hypothetical protein
MAIPEAGALTDEIVVSNLGKKIISSKKIAFALRRGHTQRFHELRLRDVAKRRCSSDRYRIDRRETTEQPKMN